MLTQYSQSVYTITLCALCVVCEETRYASINCRFIDFVTEHDVRSVKTNELCIFHSWHMLCPALYFSHINTTLHGWLHEIQVRIEEQQQQQRRRHQRIRSVQYRSNSEIIRMKFNNFKRILILERHWRQVKIDVRRVCCRNDWIN